jgi:hypothetical protein
MPARISLRLLLYIISISSIGVPVAFTSYGIVLLQAAVMLNCHVVKGNVKSEIFSINFSVRNFNITVR